jgi:hypothetical protein
MIFQRRRQSRVIGIAFEPFSDIVGKGAPLILGQCHELARDWRRLHQACCYLRRARVTNGPALEANFYVLKTSVAGQASQLFRSIQGEGQVEGFLRLGSKKFANAIDKGNIEHLSVEAPPHSEGDPAAGCEHAGHLSHCGGAVGKKLQSLPA